MAALFGKYTHSDLRQSKTILPEVPSALPYDMRNQMQWIDYSQPINPLGAPKQLLQAMSNAILSGEISYRTDREGYGLRQQVAAYNEIPIDSVLLGLNPTQMIRDIAQAYTPALVGVTSPCPVEYLLAINNAGHNALPIKHPFSFAACDCYTAHKRYGDFDAVLLGNPTYPTSRMINEDLLIGYLDTANWVIVDESFFELSQGGESFISLTQHFHNLIVVRTPSNTFAIPGTPLSYAVAHPETIKHIKQFYDSSAMSMVAEILSQQMSHLGGYLERTHDFMENEIPRLQCMLSLIPGIQIHPAEGNFVLCKYLCSEGMDLGVPDTQHLATRLQLSGFQVPVMSKAMGLDDSFFCVAAQSAEANQTLIDALRNIITTSPRRY